MGISPPKRHIFVDSFPFEEPNHRGKPKAKQKTTNRKKATPQPRTPKPRVEPTPAEVEAKQERRREYERQLGILNRLTLPWILVITDQHAGYNELTGRARVSINHSIGQYVDDDGNTTNAIESF